MGRSTLRIIAILGVICILGIAIVQIYWFKKAFDTEERQFTDRTRIALNHVANQLLDATMDSTARLESIRQQAGNYFTVEFNTGINPEYLEEALFNEFHNQNIDVNFQYGIFECDSDSFIYGSSININDYEKVEQVRYQPKADENFYFGVVFPKKSSYFVDQLRIWLIFSVLLFLVIVFFSYALFIIFKQKKLSEIKTDFINNMTHELKTPLATISASSEVLMKSNNHSEERIRTYSSIINQESKRLKQQIESVLKISVLDSKKISFNKQDLDLSVLLKNVAVVYKPVVENRGGELICEIPDSPLIVHGNKDHLENVFHNLVDNAIKYSRDAPKIKIGCIKLNRKTEVKIIDDGIGIPKNVRNRIFEKFYRVPTGNVHDAKGFGIGLYYVKKIIQEHKGSIKVESIINNGSTFIITLPLYE